LIKNILVAVDGSENSDRALDFALDISEKFNAAIMILNVSESLPMVPVQDGFTPIPEEPTAYPGGDAALISEDLQKAHEEVLSRAVAHAKKVKPNLNISSTLIEGEPAHEIVSAAKKGGFDVIVVGHRGMGKMEELFLGSVSMKVAHLTPCPVLIVK